MARWDDMPFELKSLIFKHHIRITLLSALIDMRSKDWIIHDKSSLVVREVRQLVEVAPSMYQEVFMLTKQVGKDLEQVVEDEAKAQIAECSKRTRRLLPNLVTFIEMNRDSQLSALRSLVMRIRSAVFFGTDVCASWGICKPSSR